MTSTTKKSIPYYVLFFSLWVIAFAILFGFFWQPSFDQGLIIIPFFKGAVGFFLWSFLFVIVSLLLFIYCFSKALKTAYQNAYFAGSILFGLGTIAGIFLLPYHWTFISGSNELMETESTITKFTVLINSLIGSIALCILLICYRRFRMGQKIK